MAVDNLVTDPTLIPLLQTSHKTLTSALNLIDLKAQTLNQTEASAENDEILEAQTTDSQTRSLLLAQKQLHSHLSILRGQNRAAILDVRATKSQTAEARQEVDRLHLQLQNLLYEQRHLEGEIAACEDYEILTNLFSYLYENSHAYAHLPLLPESEFLTLFPEHSDLPETELMPLRIQHEKSEREKLETQRQELLKQKAELVAENGRRKDDLKKLDERMEKFLEGAKGIMEVLEREVHS
ncbi:hypothetical protein UCRPC4_g05210 [Phaeomoniella chlamydospora]|uniref:Fms interacting protein n=1 Tax=Phaeomoniella chlamydospora TaxID=158046 RepID=A0A0G2E4R6_PHACM|nr:hypothetical protein UCRPC4_g05210 [Phaeomoniella chlamydospora]